MKTRTMLALAVIVLLAPGAGLASDQGIQVMHTWKSADKCAVKAHDAFPDYTPDANAKRDAALKACLAGSLIAPRDPLSPAAPAVTAK